MKDLKERNFEIIKVNEGINQRFQKKRIVTLLQECEQL